MNDAIHIEIKVVDLHRVTTKSLSDALENDWIKLN
jgi:hypothetical protein